MTDDRIVEVMARALYAADPVRLNMEQTPVPWERLERNGFVRSQPLAREIARAALTALSQAGYAVVPRDRLAELEEAERLYRYAESAAEDRDLLS